MLHLWRCCAYLTQQLCPVFRGAQPVNALVAGICFLHVYSLGNISTSNALCCAPQVWTFVLSSAVIRSHSVGQAYQPEMRSSKLKIVCVDAKLVDPDANPE